MAFLAKPRLVCGEAQCQRVRMRESDSLDLKRESESLDLGDKIWMSVLSKSALMSCLHVPSLVLHLYDMLLHKLYCMYNTVVSEE